MFSRIKQIIRRFYYMRIKGLSYTDYLILQMRQSGIEIGERCKIFTHIVSREPTLIQIGDNVTIAAGTVFCTHDNAAIKVIPGKTDVVGSIKVGNDCFIGINCILMYGIELGDGCIVGSGSVVTRSFPPHTVIAGNPARRLCSTEEYAQKYKKYAVDFGCIPLSKRAAFFEEHPEVIVKR